MRTKRVLYLFVFPVVFVALISWFSGGSPGGKTGSPGDAANCTQCHAGSPQPASGWLTSNIPSTGYTPGQTYSITATGVHGGVVKFGFEATAENNSDEKQGTFIITNTTETKLTNNNNAVTHTPTGNAPTGNTKSWSFDWVAPPAGTGDITFYAAFNAANGNGNTQGDVIYLSNTTVLEEEQQQTGLTISFLGMTPHIGQKLEIRLINKSNLIEFDRKLIDAVPSANFDILFENIEVENSYFIEFYADHNENGYYDAPPTDHAWRLEANNVNEGDEISFNHNTDFVDIQWKHLLILNFDGMNPHDGQLLELRIMDITQSYLETYRTRLDAITPEFTLNLPALDPNHHYNIEFYADHNGNGIFDPIPTDHAWRIKTGAVVGNTTIDFTHNTNFSDISWSYLLTLSLNGMTPHADQNLSVRLINKETDMEVSRISRKIDMEDISVVLPGMQLGEEYDIDLFADHNENGHYDSPPTDHAWRINSDVVTGNTSKSFTHNTDFEDIDWRYMSTLHADEMHPHIGQMMQFRIYNSATLEEIGTKIIDTLEVEEFFVMIPGSEYGEDYNVDFFADHNNNGDYDAPPIDHAWRIEVEEMLGDTVIPFTHNTEFTDIMWPVSVDENEPDLSDVSVFPNPFNNSVTISFERLYKKPLWVEVLSFDGRKLGRHEVISQYNSFRIDTRNYKKGVYHLIIKLEDNQTLHETLIKY